MTDARPGHRIEFDVRPAFTALRADQVLAQHRDAIQRARSYRIASAKATTATGRAGFRLLSIKAFCRAIDWRAIYMTKTEMDEL